MLPVYVLLISPWLRRSIRITATSASSYLNGATVGEAHIVCARSVVTEVTCTRYNSVGV